MSLGGVMFGLIEGVLPKLKLLLELLQALKNAAITNIKSLKKCF